MIEQVVFYCQFFNDIHVKICWEKLFKTGWSIEETIVCQSVDLHRVVLPWYISSNHHEVPYYDPLAAPLRLEHISAWLPHLKDRWRLIDKYCRLFSNGSQPVSFEIPVYCLPGGLWLALDCSHRVSALAITTPSFELHVKGILARLNCEILPDLRFWVAEADRLDLSPW